MANLLANVILVKLFGQKIVQLITVHDCVKKCPLRLCNILMIIQSDHLARMARVRVVMEGLSVGDAVGESLSYRHEKARQHQDFSIFRPGALSYTDDTAMALGIVECLERYHEIQEDNLATIFADRYFSNPDRGYGKMTRLVLDNIRKGMNWRQATDKVSNIGSYGNGSAMRSGPIGAYYADDHLQVSMMAAAAATVTHTHVEGIAGAQAVAIAVAEAWQGRGVNYKDVASKIWAAVLKITSGTLVHAGLKVASELDSNQNASAAAKILGCGYNVSCQDTVPFAIWNACRCLNNFREALISTIEVGGDCDTNGAIVGSIVSAYVGIDQIPGDWLSARESLRLND